MNYFLICLLISLLLSQTAWGEDSESEKAFSRWAVMPVIARGEETDWQFGALLIHFLPMISVDNKQSRILGATFYTTRDQYFLSVAPQIYTRDGKYAFSGGASLRYWPANYYGIGNDSSDESMKYEAKQNELQIHVERSLKHDFQVGVGFRFLREDIEFNNTSFDVSQLSGADGGLVSGLSFSLKRDTRDDIDAPYRGYYMAYLAHLYDTNFASDYSYQSHEIDLRRYFKTGNKSTFGIAAYLRSTRGDTPFRELSSPDGVLILRGIENGRYRDSHMLSFQSEYRFPIAKRFGLAIFAESAQVSDQMNQFSIDNAKYSVGSGIRWQMIPGRRFNLRADFSYVDKGVGFVVNVGEAF